MDNILFVKILNDLGKNYKGEIGFYFQYEPLTDRRLPNFLEAARFACPKARLTVSTNGSLLNEWWREKLLNNLDCIYFNVHAGTKKTYEDMQPPLKWDATMDNIKKFAKVFNGKMFVNYIKTNENKDEAVDLFRMLPSGIGIISEYWASNRQGKVDIDKPRGANTRFVTNKKCNVIGKGLYIYQDGVVPLCCEMWEREVIIGDVNEQNIYGIFNSSKKHTRHDVCKECLIQ